MTNKAKIIIFNQYFSFHVNDNCKRRQYVVLKFNFINISIVKVHVNVFLFIFQKVIEKDTNRTITRIVICFNKLYFKEGSIHKMSVFILFCLSDPSMSETIYHYSQRR